MQIKKKESHYINIKGSLMDISKPQVMGILNATPDSFYSGSRYQGEKDIAERAVSIMSEGASIIDLGAYSTRPDCVDISPEEEMDRLSFAMKIINREIPDAVVSVDTFRSSVAKMCVEEYGAAIINDISGGTLDEDMFGVVADLKVPYILMHMRGTPQTMTSLTGYDNLIEDMMLYFSQKVNKLRLMGVNDIILDPGFGFAKNLDQNYFLMKHLSDFSIFGLPLLSGISRKSMIYKLLGLTPQQSLNGTTVLNTYSLQAGANILRVHDVKEAVETVKIFNKIESV